ncbi:MAG: class A beta-lactamase [Roseateles sp.]|nr:MAG: class A beta-lactamase [Roseateles sp.]
MTISRRHLLAAGSLLPLGCATSQHDLAPALAALEARAGGRLGFAALDTGSGRLLGHRLDQRFGMCSTFKLPLAALTLRAVEQHELQDDWVALGEISPRDFAPATRAQLPAGRMKLLALAEAVQTTSDNIAANLLLARLGGPAGFTQRLRALGDPVTRLDRVEPLMNRVLPGDERDTTTPAAMAQTVAAIFTGERWLQPAGRATLRRWAEATRTGVRRLRAGLPADWPAGDKTGTGLAAGMPDRTNDVAIMWPPGRAPWVMAAYFEGPGSDSENMPAADEAVLAEAARLAVAALR